MHLLGDVLEVDFCIDVKYGFYLFGVNMLFNIFLETATEFWNIVPTQRKASSISMTAEVDKHVATTLDSCIDIKTCDTACRACGIIAITRQHNCRPDVYFRES